MWNEQKLLRKKKEIEDTKAEMSELKGELNASLKRLKEDWGCKDLATAKKKLEALNKEIEVLDNDITVATEKLEETYFSEE